MIGYFGTKPEPGVNLSCVMSLPCCPENFADCFWKIMEQFKQLGTVRASVQWEDAKQTEELFESPFLRRI